ncbi:MAG: thiamine diphosphokinase [Lawsonibacter sp.]
MTNRDRICYVVGAMSLSPALRPAPIPGDYVIAADRGYDSLMAYGVVPDLVVGDFDSLGYAPSHPNVIHLPAEKDDTDMVFALRRGLDLGYRRFVLLGGVGGRLEHTLANLQLLDWLTTQGAIGFLAGEKTAATALRDSTLTFPDSMSGYLSVFCNSGTALGVTLSNLKFPLTDYTMSGSFPIGVSNEFCGAPATVSVKQGSLLLLWEERGDFYSLLPRLWARG